MEAYCVKCKGKVEMKDPQMTQTKRGTNMMKGKCPKCDTTVCRIVGKKKPAGDDKATAGDDQTTQTQNTPTDQPQQ